MKKLLPLALIPLSIQAASTEKKLESLLNELSTVLNSSQLVCDENYARASINERACEDLHQAACIDEKGGNRYEGKMDAIVKELEDKLKAKRDEISLAMYGVPLEDAVKQALEKEGLPLVADVDAYELSRFIRKPYEYHDMSTILKSSVDCTNKFSVEDARTLPLAKKKEVLKKMVAEVKKESESNKELTPYFIEEIINAKNSECYFNKEDPYCKDAVKIKREALMLARQKDSEDYPEKYKVFFDKYIAAKELKLSDESKDIDESLTQAMEAGLKQCSMAEAANSSIARSVASNVVMNVQFSKPFIDFTLNEFYSEEKYKQAQKLFEFSRESMLSHLKEYVSDPQKYKKIEESYSELRLHWLNKPDEKEYKKEGNVLVFQGEDKLTPAKNLLSNALSDPSLNYFLDFNANYMPTESYGDAKSVTRVDMQPALLKLLETNSMAFLEILGHEVAHKVGPDISRWNGFDLSADHQKLMDCYSSAQSIGMKPNQADETLSDYFSSMILAKYIETLPPAKRLDAVIQSVESYCLFETEYMPTSSNEHPDAYLRISGILGANPKIRELMGCEGDSTKFKTCGVSK